VTIQAHDFFSPQPIKDADVFLLRYTLHDWSNAITIRILKRLREAAVPGKTRLVVIDGLIRYACAVEQKDIRGAEDIVFEGLDKGSEAPVGLLANLGRAKARNYYFDLTCGFQFLPPLGYKFSDETTGCWPSSMGKNAPWETTFE
jgi:hypothetical protein